MKKSRLSFMALMLCASVLFVSCIGSFATYNRVLDWNKGVGNKFVNELVFIALHIVPVYEVVALADILVINSIEFWSGENPMADVGKVQKIEGENGEYLVETLKEGYAITRVGSDETLNLVFNKESNTWSVLKDDAVIDLIQINQDGTADLFLPNGNTMNVTMDAQGLMAAQQLLNESSYYAMR